VGSAISALQLFYPGTAEALKELISLGKTPGILLRMGLKSQSD